MAVLLGTSMTNGSVLEDPNDNTKRHYWPSFQHVPPEPTAPKCADSDILHTVDPLKRDSPCHPRCTLTARRQVTAVPRLRSYNAHTTLIQMAHSGPQQRLAGPAAPRRRGRRRPGTAAAVPSGSPDRRTPVKATSTVGDRPPASAAGGHPTATQVGALLAHAPHG